MKIAGYILMVLGIIGGIVITIAGFGSGIGILVGAMYTYLTVCTSLSVIYAAKIPEVEGIANHSLSQIKHNIKEVNSLKQEIVRLKRENSDFKTRIESLESLLKQRGNEND